MQACNALAALKAATVARNLGRVARSVELYERALAAADADATLPRDSLLVAMTLECLVYARVNAADVHVPDGAATDDAEQRDTALTAAWRAEPRAMALSQRLLALLLARFDAGTLFAPLTPLERSTCDVFDDTYKDAPSWSLPSQRADRLFSVAGTAVLYWPPLNEPAAEEARVRGVAAAARAVLALHTRGVMMHEGRRMNGASLLAHHTAAMVTGVLLKVLDDNTATGGLLRKLRATCGLTREEEATLREDVLPVVTQVTLTGHGDAKARWQAYQRRAADDVARHGLRTCALPPSCGATEPQPKAFKVCSRCRRACYCSPAHQQQDWRRHKREDACAAAPQ